MTKSKIRRIIALVIVIASVVLMVLGGINMPKRESAAGEQILSDLRIRTLLNATGEACALSDENGPLTDAHRQLMIAWVALEAGERTLILRDSATRGIEGCFAYDGTRFYRQESVPVTEMKDAMGAGDSFLTSFLVKSIDCKKKGMTDEDAYTAGLEFASHFASEVCCAVDGSWGHGYQY